MGLGMGMGEGESNENLVVTTVVGSHEEPNCSGSSLLAMNYGDVENMYEK